MQDIKVDPIRVRKTASDIRNCAGELRSRLSVFEDIEEEIRCSWKSRYTGSYIAILERTEKKVRAAINSLENVSGNLTQIASSVEKAERELQRVMNSSGSGGGFSGGGGDGGGGGSSGGRGGFSGGGGGGGGW